MKITQLFYLFICGILLTQSCKSTRNTVNNAQNSTEAIYVFQNGNETQINKLEQTAEVDKSDFSIRFYNKRYNANDKAFYSAQIAAFLNKSELDKIKTGMLKTNLPCFEPGSGMAPDRSGKYETLIFNNSGHHYAIYENAESKRLNLISDSEEYLKLEFEINGLYYDNKEVKMAETDLNEFYLAFLTDNNLNGKIDKGELKKLTIKIK